jgi:hypothetical protein
MPRRPGPFDTETYERARELRATGLSLPKIAEATGAVYSTVHRWTRDVRPDLARPPEHTEAIRRSRASVTATLAAEIDRGGCGTPGCPDPDCDIPRGQCHCRCGGLAPLATASERKRGYVRGEPLMFILGHNRRGFSPAPMSEEALTRLRGAWWDTEEGRRFVDELDAGRLRPACWLCGAERRLSPGHFAKAWREHRRLVCSDCGPLWIAALTSARVRAERAETDMHAFASALEVAEKFERELRHQQPGRPGQPRRVAIDMVIEALFAGRRLSHAEVSQVLNRAIVQGRLDLGVARVDRDYVKTRQRRAAVRRRAA